MRCFRASASDAGNTRGMLSNMVIIMFTRLIRNGFCCALKMFVHTRANRRAYHQYCKYALQSPTLKTVPPCLFSMLLWNVSQTKANHICTLLFCTSFFSSSTKALINMIYTCCPTYDSTTRWLKFTTVNHQGESKGDRIHQTKTIRFHVPNNREKEIQQ